MLAGRNLFSKCSPISQNWGSPLHYEVPTKSQLFENKGLAEREGFYYRGYLQVAVNPTLLR
jgi:hypothetical protein